jgi:hypothetical protein
LIRGGRTRFREFAPAAHPATLAIPGKTGSAGAISILRADGADAAFSGGGAGVIEPDCRDDGGNTSAGERLQDAAPGLAGTKHASEIVDGCGVHSDHSSVERQHRLVFVINRIVSERPSAVSYRKGSP